MANTQKGSLCVLGEVKLSIHDVAGQRALREVQRDLSYYLSLPADPARGWDYDFGFGVCYVAGGDRPRAATYITDQFDQRRFSIVAFSGG